MSNSQLLKAALISSQESKRGQELPVWLWCRFASHCKDKAVPGVSQSTGFNDGCRLAEQINPEILCFSVSIRLIYEFNLPSRTTIPQTIGIYHQR